MHSFCETDGKKVSFTGFGTFESRERAARQGRNPQTGAAIDIKASRSPAFSASKTFKDRVKESKK
jgi:DNA-binding protein HU-beta